MILESNNLEATHDIGRRLGAALIVGDVVALVGPLGAGKTALVRGIAEGAGVPDSREVNSPTFVIVNEYEAPPPGRSESPQHGPGPGSAALRLYHIDTYRLRNWTDLDALGFDEMLAQGAALIEWADRVEPLLPEDRLTITLEPIDDTRRRFHCHAGGPRSQALLAALR
ncbi:MAG TPA: tRNA (adenosine(37)-N6)-threonylcarbamoyltransferase complex ATPase subunit type 1 TsaE [Phycisphaerae bacterium]|jgi:tRNA threonylcarbamoyladenosine biosynthesis protein TsaE|nr:tRNA (adenosine(37)-N6)-threonylcarbamoyltransferase complex ATPase subunit type 1 TsaE [Phycisphaerae bacterium]HXK88352.1 tRNA (adenosine(37)-N6)-threonylcarbamoyltransferase complex ATPase subunit type 1 TsaE [Phycisphaerae bacterium]